MLKIGLVGHACAGKTTVAEMLKKMGFIEYTFAGDLKAAVKLIFGLTERQVNGDLKEVVDDQWKKTPREILQLFGTDVCRENLQKYFDVSTANIWSDRMLEKLQRSRTHVVVSDVRFLNEAELIRAQKGILVRIVREDMKTGFCTHKSETEQDSIQVDYTVNNNGTIEDLRVAVCKLLDDHLDKKTLKLTSMTQLLEEKERQKKQEEKNAS